MNNQYRDQLVEHGLVVSGTFQQGRLVEIVELPDHPWFVASQFHPEFKSRPTRPAPLFREFVVAALERRARPRRRPAFARPRRQLTACARRTVPCVGSRACERVPLSRAPSTSSSSCAPSRARRARSAPSPTGSRASSTRSASSGTRTACGPAIGSTAGNVLCRLPGGSDGGVPIFLCAHFDTVPLDGELEPVVGEDGIVRNAGGTILGADNKSALAVMVEAARRIVEEGRTACGGRAPLHAEGGDRPRRRRGVRRRAARGAGRLRLRPGGADRRRRRRLADGAGARAHLRRAGRARGDVPRGGPLGDRRGRARDRRHAARAASTS